MAEAQNVRVASDGKTLTFTVDLTQGEVTEKGTTRVATSRGWQDAGDGFRYSLNVFTSDKAKSRAAEQAELESLRAELAALKGVDGATGQTTAEIAAMPGAKRSRSRSAA